MDSLNTILLIPQRCLLNKKITKAFFKRNFELTSSEKTLLDDFTIVTSIDWMASISPANANIVSYQDEFTIFEEVQVISVQSTAIDFEHNHPRIAELVQKYIPYPVVLCIWQDESFVLNTCDKKINQNDHFKRTIEKRYTTGIISQPDITEQQQQFLNSMAFAELDKTNLKTCYEAYTQRIIALQAAAVSGFYVPRTQNRTLSDLARLEKLEFLQKEILLLQSQAKKESQLSLRVEMNTQIQLKRKLIRSLIDEIKG
jgi:hypothetical protein